MIPVTRPYLPDRKKYEAYLDGIYDRAWLTNNGPLVQELTERMRERLGVDHLLLVANGTLALQVAYRAIGMGGKAITTPFSFVATPSSLKWENIEPVFSDIDDTHWCLDPRKLKMQDGVTGIVPVHVYGNACDVEAIDAFAKQHDLKVVYDAAHAAMVDYKDQSLLNWGDAATLSLHATKLLHSVEGGVIVFKKAEHLEIAKRLINFGQASPEDIREVGINAKLSEMHAAMGLCVLDDIDIIMEKRGEIWNTYEKALKDHVQFQNHPNGCTPNYAYAPIALKDETELLRVETALKDIGAQPRRYFRPSLNRLGYVDQTPCPVSESLAARVLCLPIFAGLDNMDAERIIQAVLKGIAS